MKKYPPQSTTEQVAQACLEESKQARQQEQGSCFELFCRAFDQQDSVAWEAIQTQYHKLMRQWLHASASDLLRVEEEEDLLQESLHHFWQTLAKQSTSIRIRFPHVGALLNYLRQCTYTAVVTQRRRQQKQTLLYEKLSRLAQDEGSTQELAYWEKGEETIQQLQQVRAYISNSVADPQEQLLLHLTYRLGLKPKEIVARCPEDFATVKEVQRVKERLLKRMRRALAA